MCVCVCVCVWECVRVCGWVCLLILAYSWISLFWYMILPWMFWKYVCWSVCLCIFHADFYFLLFYIGCIVFNHSFMSIVMSVCCYMCMLIYMKGNLSGDVLWLYMFILEMCSMCVLGRLNHYLLSHWSLVPV